MTGDGSTIKSRIRNLLRSPSIKRKKNRNEDFAKVMLERVLGITAAGNCGLACDPHSGLVAYPAGCVVVLLNPKKNQQHHILNTSRKAITALCFSPDGRYLVTGESGHLPAVRVWDVAERRQVAELQEHKYGVSCVAFSPNSKYIVSVGYQHDMMVNVWAWKKDIIVAANKVSSKVTAVSFSEDSSYFVTAGNRHVRFWYLDHSKPTKASAPVPLLGRSGLLGELRNNFFCDVACGRGSTSESTFCITSSGLLCEFNSKRTLDKWVDLRTSAAHSLSVSDELIFCGCGDGTVRAFSPVDLRFVCTLPRPHPLGTDVSSVTQASHLFSNKMAARYPDAMAMTYDPVSHWLSCIYNDHSLYVWDVRDPHRVGKVHSALYHASCVWDLQMFPEVPEGSETGLSSGVFFSCSADNTIRLWTVEEPGQAHAHSQRNVLSNDLLKVIYVDDNTAALLDMEGTTCVNTEKGDRQTAESRTGVRTICVSPDGQHLASGDRNGMLRVHNLKGFEEIQKVVAHDSEILCLEYSKPATGLRLLATASRDRLIHVLDAEEDYGLVQTLDEHSSSITAVRFAVADNKVRMISCGADKSIYFRTAHRSDGVTEFRRSHHVVIKTTLYDMDVDLTCKYAAVGCQDRCIRIFNIISGKQKKIYKGSVSEDGSLLKLQTDPSGLYVATSCSDKNISIFDFQTGECVATMFGHSEIVTGMRFTNDCKHLISASGDSCIFIWRLAPELTANMKERLCQLRKMHNASPSKTSSTLRREAYAAHALAGQSSESDREHEEEEEEEEETARDDLRDPVEIPGTSSESSQGDEDTGGSDEGPNWESKKERNGSPVVPNLSKKPRRRWSCRMDSLEVMVKSMLDLRQLEAFSLPGSSHKKGPASRLQGRDAGSTSSLQDPAELEEKIKTRRFRPHSDWLTSHLHKGSRGSVGAVLYPEGGGDAAALHGSQYLVKELRRRQQQESRSPDSACSIGYDSREPSPDQAQHDSDSVDPLSSDRGSSESEHDDEKEEEEEEEEEEIKIKETSMDEAMRALTDVPDHSPKDFLRQNFETLQDDSTTERTRASRLSISARFLARGSNNRRVPVFTMAQSLGQSAKPLVSRVRPLMQEGQGRSSENRRGASSSRLGDRLDSEVPEKGLLVWRPNSQKRRSPGGHLWKMSGLVSRAALSIDRHTALQKSQSAVSLLFDDNCSQAPSGGGGGGGAPSLRPQFLSISQDSSRSASSLPSSTSPLSPLSPVALQPWEAPKLKSPLSYMNPTTSSMAKTSRSDSRGEAVQLEDESGGPTSSRSPGVLDAEAPLLTSSALSPLSCAHSSPSTPSSCSSPSSSSSQSGPLPSSPSPSPLCAAVSPNLGPAFSPNVPPSRIPLPKQPLSSRRSICPETMTLPDWSSPPSKASTHTGGPANACDGTANTGNKPALRKRLSLPLPVKPEKDLVPESLKSRSSLGTASCKDVPLVSIQACSVTTSTSQPDTPITLETCTQAAADLHDSLRRVTLLYTKVLTSGSDVGEEQQQMRRILTETMAVARAQLESLPCPTTPHGRAIGDAGVSVESGANREEGRAIGDAGVSVESGAKREENRTLALLEQYSELLLKSVEKKMDSRT